MKLPSDIYKNVWFPFTCSEDIISYPPRVIEKGEGMYVFDSDNKKYLDAIGSWWVSILGHRHPRINAALKKQLDNLEHVMMAGFISPAALTLSQELVSILPNGLDRIFFSDDGSTAVETALKMALQYWKNKGEKKSRFIAFKGGYHGDTLGAMSVGNIPAYHGLFHDSFKSNLSADSPYCYRCPKGMSSKTCNAECMESLEKILEDQGENVAACIFEPIVQGAGGMRIYPSKVLSRLFSACSKYGVLTIADEVAVGFGRTGKMFACEHASLTPDILCMAKGLTSGYVPMAATAAKEKVYTQFCGDFMDGKELSHGHSFTGNPLAAAIACETIAVLKEQNIPRSLESKTTFFTNYLKMFDSLDCVGDIRSVGMIGAIELVEDRKTKKPFDPKLRIPFRIAQKALDKGVIIRPLGNVLYFVPAYIISDEQISFMVDVTKESIVETLV